MTARRKASGAAVHGQIVAANIDTLFICMALNHDFNLRRLERYLALAWDSGAIPVIVLTKADLCEALEQRITEAQAVIAAAPARKQAVLDKYL